MLNVKYDANTDRYILRNCVDVNHKFKNPFDIYGFGIKSYFLVLKTMIYAFICLSILFAPVIVIYSKGNNYIDKKNQSNYWQISTTLGNMG